MATWCTTKEDQAPRHCTSLTSKFFIVAELCNYRSNDASWHKKPFSISLRCERSCKIMNAFSWASQPLKMTSICSITFGKSRRDTRINKFNSHSSKWTAKTDVNQLGCWKSSAHAPWTPQYKCYSEDLGTFIIPLLLTFIGFWATFIGMTESHLQHFIQFSLMHSQRGSTYSVDIESSL